MAIFIDTGYFIARMVQQDQWHRKAVRAELADHPAVTSSLVINETVTFLQRKGLFSSALQFLQQMRGGTGVRIIPVDPVLQSAGWDLLAHYGGGGANIVDCTSFAVMRSMAIKRAFTFDEHYRSAGFQILH